MDFVEKDNNQNQVLVLNDAFCSTLINRVIFRMLLFDEIDEIDELVLRIFWFSPLPLFSLLSGFWFSPLPLSVFLSTLILQQLFFFFLKAYSFFFIRNICSLFFFSFTTTNYDEDCSE
jgi:hypothetical protein